MRLISIYRHGKNTKILMSGNHPPVEQGRLHNPMNIKKKKKMKTKPHIVDSYTHANAQKNIWQDPHSASYFPGAPADPPPDATLPAPWEADLNEQHQGGAHLPAGGECCSRRTKEWKRMRSDYFPSSLSMGSPNTGHIPQVTAPFRGAHSFLFPGSRKVRRASWCC